MSNITTKSLGMLVSILLLTVVIANIPYLGSSKYRWNDCQHDLMPTGELLPTTNLHLTSPTDPFLAFSNRVGGSVFDSAENVARDENENLIVTGITASPEFPTTPEAFDTTHNGGGSFHLDLFLLKMTPNGTLLWSTFVGGSLDEWVNGLIIDSQDNIIITGTTYSLDFPVVNAYEPEHANGSNKDIFVSKFSPEGDLLWSTYLGGTEEDKMSMGCISLDSQDNIVIAGATQSSDFPVTEEAYCQTHHDSSYPLEAYDGFIAKLSSNGSLVWSSYLGGKNTDVVADVICDHHNDVIVVGRTKSSDFPVLNALNFSFAGEQEAFMAKLSANGSDLVWGTFMGGSQYDRANSVAVDTMNTIVVMGESASDNFPTLNAFQPTRNGDTDVFLAKLSPDATTLLWSTYLGSFSNDYPFDMTIDPYDNTITVAGETWGTDFPTLHAYAPVYNGGTGDAFVSEFASNGSLRWSTFFGGNKSDHTRSIFVDKNGKLLVAGYTYSLDFPITTTITSGDNNDTLMNGPRCTPLVHLPSRLSGTADAFISCLRDPLDDWMLLENLSITYHDLDADTLFDTIQFNFSLTTTGSFLPVISELRIFYQQVPMGFQYHSSITSNSSLTNGSSTSVSLSFTAETAHTYRFDLSVSSARETLKVYELTCSLHPFRAQSTTTSTSSSSNPFSNLLFIGTVGAMTIIMVTKRRKR